MVYAELCRIRPASQDRRLVSGHGFRRVSATFPYQWRGFSPWGKPSLRTGALAPAALFALHGGDEYELLFTARPDKTVPKTIAGVPVTRIGEILSGQHAPGNRRWTHRPR